MQEFRIRKSNNNNKYNSSSKFKKRKKAVSPVIATILLVLLSITAVSIIASFVLDFINDSLEGADCFKLQGNLEIDNAKGYHCHYTDSETNKEKINITIKRILESEEIGGMIITINGDSSSESFEIKQGSADNGVSMYGGGDIELPDKGERRTYEITTNFGSDESLSAIVAPIATNKERCNPVENSDVNIIKCE
jgi:FlaG/FlaF family flagellin (archaellin)